MDERVETLGCDGGEWMQRTQFDAKEGEEGGERREKKTGAKRRQRRGQRAVLESRILDQLHPTAVA